VILHPTGKKTGHFRDVSPSQSIGLVWKEGRKTGSEKERGGERKKGKINKRSK